MTRADILAVLEKHAGIVDDVAERETLATALHDAMVMHPDAVFVRERLRISPCGTIAVMEYRFENRDVPELLMAARRLAGGEP